MADCQISEKVKAEMSDKGFLMNLPSEIIVEILSRLPALSVINCKVVCKKSYSLLSTPEFAKLHLSRSTPGLVAFHCKLDIEYIEVCSLLEFQDEIDHHDICYNPVMDFESPVADDIKVPTITMIVGSVNGLVCLRNILDHNYDLLYYLCNPITRECVILPLLELPRYSTPATFGFGVSTISGQYKVVRFFNKRVLEPTLKIMMSDCRVYTIGSGSWRIIEGVPLAYEYNSCSAGTFFNGNLHWVVKNLEGTEFISCFNLETELFQPFPAPFDGEQSKTTFYDLGVVSGSLCLCDNTSDFDIVIWVMKEYGVKKSWAKEFVIVKMPDFAWPNQKFIRALHIFKDGDILLEGNRLLFYCNQGKKSVRQVDINIDPDYFFLWSLLHVSSFLSLKHLFPNYTFS